MNIIAKILRGGGKSLTYLLAGVFALFVGSTWAGYCYWTGGGSDTLWSTAGNWKDNALPGSADKIYFRANKDGVGDIDNMTVSLNGAYTNTVLHVGSGSSAENPFIFTADQDSSHGLTFTDDGWLGCYENGGLWLKSGTYAFTKQLHIGQDIYGDHHDFSLKVGDGMSTASLTAKTQDVNMYAGSVLVADKATLDIASNAKSFALYNSSAAYITNSTATFGAIRLRGASSITVLDSTIKVGYDLNVADESGANCSLLGGSSTIELINGANVFNVGSAENSTGVVTKNGGDWSCYYLRLGIGNNATGKFTMNGGTLTVNRNSNDHFSIGYGSCAAGEFNLNGGTVTAIKINSNGTGTLTFNGGTLKAREAGTLIVDSANLTVTVDAGGGTIDSNNKAITVAKAIGGSGAMTYRGGNTITLSGAANYTGGTTIEGGTCVAVADRAAATALIGSALNVTLPATQLSAGAHALVTITGTADEDVFTAEDLAKVAFAFGVKVMGCYSFALSTDSKSIMLWTPNTERLWAADSILVFPGKTLADLATHTLRARMQGDRFDADGVEVTFFGRKEKRDDDDNLTNVTYQLQTLDEVAGYHYTKSTKVEFTADDYGVRAKIASGNFSNFGAQNVFGTDPLDSNGGWNDYIPYDLRIVTPVTDSINVNFTYGGNNLDTSSSVRYGGGDYAVPYSAWKNMSAENGSATIGGATWTISNGAGHRESTSLSATKDLRHGFIGDSDENPTPTVTVTEVPYEAYRIVVYASAQDDDAKYGHVTINGCDYTASGDALNSVPGDSVTTVKGDSAWGKDNAGSGMHTYGLKEGLNYLVSSVTGGKTATIVGHRGDNAEGVVRGGIAAIQIVKVDALEDGDTLPLKVMNGSLERTSMFVALPVAGKATLEISGARLGGGDHVLFTGVGADALDHLTIDIAPDVLDGRKYSIAVTDDGKIVLNIKPDGFLMIVR